MKAEENKVIAEKWMQAFNLHDVEKILDLYDDDAQHFSPKLKQRKPETRGLIIGKQQMRSWWKDAFERLPTLKYDPVKYTANNEQVFMEYTRLVDGEEPMSVAEVIEIKDGKIVASRVYHG